MAVRKLFRAKHTIHVKFVSGEVGERQNSQPQNAQVILAGHLLLEASQGHPWLPWWLSSKEPACNARDLRSVPGSGRSPRGGNGNPLQCSCLENPLNRGAWWATVHEVAKSWK